jgi:plastocyanin
MPRLPGATTGVRLTVAALGLAVVAACGGSTPSSGSGTSTGRSLAVTVTGKQVTPAPDTVDLAVGQTLTLTVTSDHDDQLHAHGFEVERDVKAGVPTTVALKGAEPGVYDVEMHHPELKLLSVAVR